MWRMCALCLLQNWLLDGKFSGPRRPSPFCNTTIHILDISKTQSLHNYVCSVLKYRILALMKLCSPAVSLYCITQKETDRLAMCGLQVSSAVGHVGGRDYNSYPLIQNFGNSATMPI
jgi:hypothetical protein